MTNYVRDGTAYRVRIKMTPLINGPGKLTGFKATEKKLATLALRLLKKSA